MLRKASRRSPELKKESRPFGSGGAESSVGKKRASDSSALMFFKSDAGTAASRLASFALPTILTAAKGTARRVPSPVITRAAITLPPGATAKFSTVPRVAPSVPFRLLPTAEALVRSPRLLTGPSWAAALEPTISQSAQAVKMLDLLEHATATLPSRPFSRNSSARRCGLETRSN